MKNILIFWLLLIGLHVCVFAQIKVNEYPKTNSDAESAHLDYFANELFKTQPLSLSELLICIGLSVIVFHAVEAEKLVKKMRRKRAH